MKFRDYAANETSLLVSRLLAKRSKKSLGELEALRRALDEALSSFEATVNVWAKIEQDEEIPEVSERLTNAAGQQAQALVQAAKAETESAVSAARAETEAAAKVVRAELEAKIKELEGKVKEIDKASAALRADLATHKERGEKAIAELTKADEAKGAIQHQMKELHEMLETTRADSARLIKKLEAEGAEKKKLLAAVEAAKAALRAAEDQRLGLNKQLTESAARVDTLADSLDRGKAEHERAATELQAKIEAARGEAQAASQRADQAANALTRLVTVFEKIGACTDVAHLLTTLADGLADDFSRVALFSVRGKRLEGVYQVGSDSETDISKILIPITMHPLMSKAVASGRIEAAEGAKVARNAKVPFGGSAGCALALPVEANGEVIAVIHADDAEGTQNDGAPLSRRVELAEILRRHALPALEKLVISPKVAAELRTYATSLLDQIESVYSADVKASRADAQLESRVAGNLQCARDLFARRVEGEMPAAASLFDEQLAAFVAERGSTKFGKAIAAAVKHQAKPDGSAQAAQAS